MTRGSHDFAPDPRNEDVLVYVNGDLVPRSQATVSVFDSGFILGDGVWEGIRLHHGRFAFLDRHLDRLFEGAKTIDLDIGRTRAELVEAMERTVRENDMHDGVHLRLMVTRGLKRTPTQDPRYNVGPATVVITAEYKIPPREGGPTGLRLITSHIRRGPPEVQDPRLNSHSKLNCILGMIDALKKGGDEALMLDPLGFVSTCNSTNFFIVRGEEVWTSTGNYCMNGITRGVVIEIAREDGIPVKEKNFSLVDVYGADEAFVTGTAAGLMPVSEVDGRPMGEPSMPGPMTKRLLALYEARLAKEGGVPAGAGR